MLHYFLAAGVDDDELGDLSFERMPKPIGPAEEGPVPIYKQQIEVYGSGSQFGKLCS